MTLRPLAALAILVLALTLPALSAPSGDPTRGLEAFVNGAMARYQVPGAVVAVVRKGEVVHLQGYGVRHAGRAEKVGADTIFPLASVTKTFTAAAVGRMVDEGRLDWDAPVVDRYPDVQLAEPFPTAQVSVRDFLVHRSGLPFLVGDLFDKLGYSREEVVRRLRSMPLSTGFRQKPAYSNVGFFLAGMASAHAAGLSWEDLVRSRLLEPMRMTRSGFFTGPLTPEADVAYPHMLENGRARAMSAIDVQGVLAPAGLMTSTGRDMAHFALMHLNRGTLNGVRVLKEETVDEIFEPVIAEKPGIAESPPTDASTGFDYSPGWGVYHYNGYKIVEKNGARAGVRSIVVLIPEQELGVVVLCNLNGTMFPESVRAYVMEQVAGSPRYDLQAAIVKEQETWNQFLSGVSLGPPTAPKMVAPLGVPLANLVGAYDSPLYGRLTVHAAGDHLRWELGPARYGGTLFPTGRTSFQMNRPPGGITLPDDVTFVVDAQGRPSELQTESYGNFTRMK